MTKRVLICANPDLNFIDGSSIWAQTIALATAATGDAEVIFMAKSTPTRDELFAPLKAAPGITIVDGSDQQKWQGKGYARITPPMMAELALRLDRSVPFDVIIVRGLEIASRLIDDPEVLSRCWIYLTDIPQSLAEYSPERRSTMQRIARGCGLLLSQTDGFRELWQALVPDLPESKIRLYTPVIPDPPAAPLPLAERPKRAIYAGKFKSDWMTLEMAEAWPAIQAAVPDSELVMIGDKIHNEPDQPDFSDAMRRALEGTLGLTWLGAQSRADVQTQLLSARVGLSWRDESMNDTVEYSTKILEYGGAGCAAILNRNPLHESLLGRDYPLFANSRAEFGKRLTLALSDPQVAQTAADSLRKLAERHSFSNRVGEIRQWLSAVPKAPGRPPKIKVLVAGHDLKFFKLLQRKLEDTGRFEFLVDQWQGHDRHDEAQSRKLLDQADVIFCEWCLGNIKWYSHNKRSGQRLVARFHAQEVRTPYLNAARWDRTDHVSFVSEHTRQAALTKMESLPQSKTSVIPNLLDEQAFAAKKKTGEAQFTLGILGAAPKSKRLDRAIDLLEALLEDDSRYCLRVKGKNPLDYPWLLNRQDELFYYRGIFERINQSPVLRHKVIFDPPGDDVNDWFTLVGFILSPSDFESFHMAIGEGMLTGTVPIIWNWEGASDIWGAHWVVHSLEEARLAVIQNEPAAEIAAEVKHAMPSSATTDRWAQIIGTEQAAQ